MTPTAEAIQAAPTDSTYIPTRDEICGRMREAVAAGASLESLDRNAILAVTEERIIAADATRIAQPPTLSNMFTRSRRGIPLPVDMGGRVAITGKGGRTAMGNLMQPWFQDNDYYGVVETVPTPGDRRLLSVIPAGMLAIHFPDSFSDVNLRAQGRSYKMASSGLVTRFSESPSWSLIHLPAEANAMLMTNADEYPEGAAPVAAVSNDGNAVVIFVSLFSTASGMWQRAIPADSPAEALFKAIMEVAKPLLTSLWVRPVQDPQVEQIRAAVRTFETMRALASGSMRNITRELATARDQLARSDRELETFRERLVAEHRRRAEYEERIEVLANGSEGRVLESMNSAFSSMDVIERHRGIRNVEFVQNSGQPIMRITTRDFALNSNERSHRRLIKGITFDMNMGSDNHSCLSFAREIPANQPAVHPHVSGNHACWGEAEPALYDAIGRKDWVSVVNFVLGWMLQYNHRSPYSAREGFPTTALQVGWIQD